MKSIIINEDGSITRAEVDSLAEMERLSRIAAIAAVVELRRTIGGKVNVYRDGELSQIDAIEGII